VLLVLSGKQISFAQQLPPAQAVSVDVAGLRRQLTEPGAGARSQGPPTHRIALPTLNGSRAFVLLETHVLPATDAAAQQRLRTFVGYEESAPAHRVSLVLTPQGLTADLLAGPESASLRPAASGGYLLKQVPGMVGTCGTASLAAIQRTSNASTLPAPFSFGTQLRKIRYAILVTQEYYSANGNTDAAVEQTVVTVMNQMTALYLQELAVSFELVKPTGGTRYFSAMTTATLDASAAAATGRLRFQNLDEVNSIITTRFPSGGFEAGHCFHIGSDRGSAGASIICTSGKAKGWSTVQGTGFQGILAHEMGHQQGASHTHTADCSADLNNDVEPGNGTTIMSYSHGCTQTLIDMPDTDNQRFNALSLSQMSTYLQSVSCPALTANTNHVPSVNAGADYVIPLNTPFTLTATGSDPDGETLAYTWDQLDHSSNINALGTIVGQSGLAAINDPDAALFRPRPPRTTLARTFPDLRYILANSNKPADLVGEALPNVGRDLNFVVMARDQRASGGTIATDNVKLTVAPNTGPFAVTTQNANPTLWIAGQSTTVTWSVNGTNQAPINVSQVRITLSTDGGQTFGTVLAAGVPNTGSASVAVPNVTTTQARVRVEAVGNIFFDINDADFPINACSPVASQLLPATAVTAAPGDAALNLNQQAYSVVEYVGTNQIKGTISATDPTSYLSNYDSSNCSSWSGNVTPYDAFPFVPSATSTYTISMPTSFGGMVVRVYAGSFNPTDPCQNAVADNLSSSGGALLISNTVTVALTAGQPYTLIVSNFGGTPAATSNYALSFASSVAGGTVYAPLQSVGYDYQYAVVNTATGTVVQLAPTADLRTLPAGTYDVYGLLFQRGYAINSLQGGSLSNLQAALARTAPCGQLSNNARRVIITGATSGVATFYRDCSFSGTATTLAVGTYTLSQLQASGIINNDISSLKVSAGYEVQLYDGDNFTGTSLVVNADNSCLVTNSFNDLTTSLQVRAAAAPSGTLAAAASSRAVALTLYPNPVTDQLSLTSGDEALLGGQVRILSVDGREVWHGTYDGKALNVSRLQTGLYILLVDAKGQTTQAHRFNKL